MAPSAEPEEAHGRISSRIAYDLRYPVPPGVGDEVPVPRPDGGGCSSGAGADPPELHESGPEDPEGAHREGPRAPSGVVSAVAERREDRAVPEGPVLAAAAGGVSALEEAVLGSAPLGPGVLLRDGGGGDDGNDLGV